MNWTIEFYMSPSGKYPVKDFLKEHCGTGALCASGSSQDPAAKKNKDQEKLSKKLLAKIASLEKYGPALQYPDSQKMPGTDDIYELRVDFKGVFYRIFYFFHSNRTILLHGIKKKTNQTPPNDIATCNSRRRDWERRNLNAKK